MHRLKASALEIGREKIRAKTEQFQTGTEDDFYRLYTLGKKLGEGAFAQVYVCTSNANGDEFAAKLVDKRKAGMGQLKDIHHEVNVMKGLYHRGIISLFGSYEGGEHLIIVMNRVCGGTLFDRIIKCKNYTEDMAAGAIANALEALGYLHGEGISHRDLKPENLLLRAEYKDGSGDEMTDVVIADFGLAARPPMRATCGSPYYVAPEVILASFGDNYGRKCEPYTSTCDVWSLGVVLYVMLSGRFPFVAPSRNSLFNLIINNDVAFNEPVWKEVSDDAKAFIRLLLTKDPNQRPTARHALQDPWITGQGLSCPLLRQTTLAQSVMELKKFTLRRHVNSVMSMYRVAGTLFGNYFKPGQDIPAFLKYVKADPSRPLELRIRVQSQTSAEKIYEVDIGRIVTRTVAQGSATTTQPHPLNTVCNCPSVMVCRHIQYVYQWLFMGERDMDVAPYVSKCEEMKVELNEQQERQDITIYGLGPVVVATAALTYLCTVPRLREGGRAENGEATGVLGAIRQLAAHGHAIYAARAAAAGALIGATYNFRRLVRRSAAVASDLSKLETFLLSAFVFRHAFDQTPVSDRKAVLTGSILPSACAAFQDAGRAYRSR